MTQFAIIETDSGLTVVPVARSHSAEATASAQGGVLIDPGPYDSYEAAYDAMTTIPIVKEEELGDSIE